MPSSRARISRKASALLPALRLSGFHRPYLVMAVVWGLITLGEPFSSVAPVGPQAVLWAVSALLFLCVHQRWLARLVADVGTGSPLVPRPPALAAIVIVAVSLLAVAWHTAMLVTAAVVMASFTVVWRVFVLARLFTVVGRRLPDGAVAVALARHRREVAVVSFGAILLACVDVLLLGRTRYLDAAGRLPSLCLELGPWIAGVTVVLRLLLHGQFVWFAARATPNLYRAYSQIRGDAPGSEGRG